jgi:hypothetical protein
MKSSTKIGVNGARPHSVRANIIPIDSKILMVMLCIQLLECCIINSIEILPMNILHVCINRVIHEVWNLL